MVRLAALLCLLPLSLPATDLTTIRVDAGSRQGAFPPSWAYFGYDEANYTYTNNGQKLIKELAALSYEPVHIRTHFLLSTGDGRGALKWGSTNAYTEDAGRPVYEWRIVDRILGTYAQAGAVPFVEIGFMPHALSSHPEPYTTTWIPGQKNEGYFAGWTYPPADYNKWSDLVYHLVTHCIDKFGESEVKRWDWEVWNEPDIGYWHGTPEEYNKLYDYTVAAVKRALPTARVGGPASTGPANQRAAAFLRQFLEHCASGNNAATGKAGAPLDFISFHAKGRPRVIDGHVEMGISQEMTDAVRGFEIVRSFAKFKDLPIILSEADPEGCAACSARVYPQNAYRNRTLYAAYEAAALKTLLQLATAHHVNLRGILTWAFEFEDQPYFDGFRTLATNGIDKPVLNFFRMAGLMRGDLVPVESSGALPPRTIQEHGIPGPNDVDALATRSDRRVTVMVWNYGDNEVAEDSATVQINIAGLPSTIHRALLREYRLDGEHSNSFTVWKQRGSPQDPTPQDYKVLEEAGQLHLLNSPRWVDVENGSPTLSFTLPPEAISLFELEW
jgi:xylan 1,4-beta-xylosidase